MLILLFISILCVQRSTPQACIYNVDQFERITCTGTEKIRQEINETLEYYHSLPKLIEFVEFRDCNLLSLSIHSLTRFLPNLNELRVFYNNIKKLSTEKIEDFPKDFTETTNGNGT